VSAAASRRPTFTSAEGDASPRSPLCGGAAGPHTPDECAAALRALLLELRTLALLWTRGLLTRYPLLKALPLPAPAATTRPGDASPHDVAPPPATVHLDCSRQALGVSQDALASLLHPTLRALARRAHAAADAQWHAALTALHAAPPCAWGMGHRFCVAGERGCALREAEAPLPGAPPPCPGDAAARAVAAYLQPIACLRLLPSQASPTTRAALIRSALQCMPAAAALEQRLPLDAAGGGAPAGAGDGGGASSALGADDLLPRLCFVVLAARVCCLPSELAMVEAAMPADAAAGQDGYAVVSLRGALMHVLARGADATAAAAAAAGEAAAGAVARGV
jgi:hypothetical protein